MNYSRKKLVRPSWNVHRLISRTLGYQRRQLIINCFQCVRLMRRSTFGLGLSLLLRSWLIWIVSSFYFTSWLVIFVWVVLIRVSSQKTGRSRPISRRVIFPIKPPCPRAKVLHNHYTSNTRIRVNLTHQIKRKSYGKIWNIYSKYLLTCLMNSVVNYNALRVDIIVYMPKFDQNL